MLRKLKRKLFGNKYLLQTAINRLNQVEKRTMALAMMVRQNSWASRETDPVARQEADDLCFFVFERSPAAVSQHFQDIWVLWETGQKRNGFFVEFGAADAMEISNSLLLEKDYGWKGILAEPLPLWHPRLEKRKAMLDKRCVWSRSGETLKFVQGKSPFLSGAAAVLGNANAAASIEVPTVSLNDLLSEHGAPKVIDYLSIDVEGAEYEILSNFDFSKHSFRVITIEYGERREDLHRLLASHGYTRKFSHLSFNDDWYVHKSHVRGA